MVKHEALFRGLAGIANVGVAGHGPRTARRLRVINAAAAIAAIYVAGGMVADTIYGVPSLHPVTLWNLAFLAGYLGVFWINRRGRPLHSAMALTLVAWANVLVTTIYVGTPHGLHVFFIAIAALTVLMTREGQEPFVAVAGVISAGLYGYSQIYLTKGLISPFSHAMLTALMLSSVVGAIIVVVLPPLFFRRLVDRAERELAAAHARTNELLHAILPVAIADRLERHKDQVIADRFDDVTVMFADIVSFTAQAASLPASELVRRLNQVFSTFDALNSRYGVEKIKTIGDAYMAAGGVPAPLPDHAERVVSLAGDMMAAVQRLAAAEWPGLQLRIGIHSGPVVAGVIGQSKFAYDVWGSTVNTASRLEGACSPGEILISDTTRRLLGPKFECHSPRRVTLRGQGEVDVWTVVATP